MFGMNMGRMGAVGGVLPFTPSKLFTGTTTGAWYDPSDTTTLYRDAAGTTPVTAVEQPVGLMLDKSKGLVLGPELVTNGDFSNGSTGWTGGSVSSGRMVVPLYNESTQAITLVAGRTYQVIFDIDASLGAGRITVGGSLIDLLNTTKVGARYYIAPADTTALRLGCISGTSASYDNISVREIPGNHAFNSSGNSANFPVLSARVNLLTKTEQFDDAYWSKLADGTGSLPVVTANATTAPDGTLTADRVVFNAGNSYSLLASSSVTSTNNSVFKLYVKSATGLAQRLVLYWYSGQSDTGNNRVLVDVPASGWSIVQLPISYAGTDTLKIGTRADFYPGAISADVYIWGADLRVANDALNQPAYQRVNTSTDYDTSGFKPYLHFNGTNQWLQTNSINFSYGDKMFVCAGVRKLSDASGAFLIELSTDATANSGAFAVTASSGTPRNRYGWYSSGTTLAGDITLANYVAPITNILSGIGDISGDQAILRVNGAQVVSSTVDQGTGNYGNYPLYLGARAGTSLWFNGRLYQMIVAGKQASAAEITSTETYLNQKTGAF